MAPVASILPEVLRLYNRGLSVFPVSTETKIPAAKWGGISNQMPTQQQVEGWFSKPGMAVGIATGPVSNILLLDFDFKHTEAKEFYENLQLPYTWKERTGSGGIHVYFKWDEILDSKQTNTQSKICIGVDTKGTGGYSKICPSPGYEWIIPPHMAALASVPQWLIDGFKPKDGNNGREIVYEKKPQDWIIKELEAIKPGSGIDGRTPTFCRVIGNLKARGLSEVEVKSWLSLWAEKHGYPKLDYLVADQFKRYPPRLDTQIDLSDNSLKSFLTGAEPVSYLVSDLVYVNSINILAGLQESRKSWLLLDLAIAVASGTLWLDRFQCKRGKVLIFDQERPKGEMQRRISALLAARSLTVDDIEGSLIPKVGTSFCINLDASFEGLRRLISTLKPELILIDSLKAFQNGDTKQDQDMQKVFERFKQLRNEYNVAIVILHHENKGAYEAIREKQTVTAERVAGSNVINEVPEGIFIVRNHDSVSSFFHHSKNNYGTKLAPFLIGVRDIVPDKSKIIVEAR